MRQPGADLEETRYGEAGRQAGLGLEERGTGLQQVVLTLRH